MEHKKVVQFDDNSKFDDGCVFATEEKESGGKGADFQFVELNELQRIVNRLESIQQGNPAAVLENLAEWLNFDAPKMGPLLDDLRNELMKHAGTLG